MSVSSRSIQSINRDISPADFFLSAPVADVKVAEETVEPDKGIYQHDKHQGLICQNTMISQ